MPASYCLLEESLSAFLRDEQLRESAAPFRLAHTIVRGEQFPNMTFAQMLEATVPNRFPVREEDREQDDRG